MNGLKLNIKICIITALAIGFLMAILNLYQSWSQHHLSVVEPFLYVVLICISFAYLMSSFEHPNKRREITKIGKMSFRLEHAFSTDIDEWACKTYGLTDADLELLIYLDCKGRFTRNDFINGVYTYSWDKNRWERLKREGWIETWRHRNRTTIKYSVFKTSWKCSQMISRIYRILLGEEDLPTSERSVFYKNKSYTDKVYNKAIDDMIKDKDR